MSRRTAGPTRLCARMADAPGDGRQSHAGRANPPPALIVLPISGVFLFSAINYFPGHFRYITQRFAYYVFGDESIDILAAWRDAIAGWLAGLHIWAVGALGSGSPRAAPVAVKGEL